MTDYCNTCGRPWIGHGTACIPTATRIAELEQRVSQLERDQESRLSYKAKGLSQMSSPEMIPYA